MRNEPRVRLLSAFHTLGESLRSQLFCPLLMLLIIVSCSEVIADGTYFTVERPGELIYGVTYTVWIPEGVAKLRGVIVH